GALDGPERRGVSVGPASGESAPRRDLHSEIPSPRPPQPDSARTTRRSRAEARSGRVRPELAFSDRLGDLRGGHDWRADHGLFDSRAGQELLAHPEAGALLAPDDRRDDGR